MDKAIVTFCWGVSIAGTIIGVAQMLGGKDLPAVEAIRFMMVMGASFVIVRNCWGKK